MEEVLQAKMNRWYVGKSDDAAVNAGPVDPAIEDSAGRNLMEAGPGTYIIKKIDTNDDDMSAFLFRLTTDRFRILPVLFRRIAGCFRISPYCFC